MNEEAKGDDALPPYEERFKATEDKVIDCLSQLNRYPQTLLIRKPAIPVS